LNGDGKPDLVVAMYWGGVGVLLGNGDGTFQPAVTYGSGGIGGWISGPVTVADVNRDGRPDLIVANGESGTVGVLLGNGDGTFQPAATFVAGSGPWSAAVADVNGDGKPDLLVANYPDSTVGVLLANGDGTFQAVVTYGSGEYQAASIAVADVNGDGKPDMVVANDCPGTCEGSVSVLLGNGDGTFQAPVLYDSGGWVTWEVVIADVNGDGKPDVVVINAYAGYTYNISVLLGNGDGTFQSALTYGSGVDFDFSIAVADVNGDGKLDLVVENGYGGNNGDGSVSVLLHTNPPTTTTLVSSLNPSVYGQSVTFTAAVSAAAGTPTGTLIFYDGPTAIGSAPLTNGSASTSVSSLTAGLHPITAAYQGSSGFFDPSTSAPLNQVVNPETTATSLVSSRNPALVTDPVTYTATVASQYGGAVTGPVVFQDGGSTFATVTVAGNQAAYTTKYGKPGAHSITATYSGDTNNTGSISATLTEQINKGFTSKTKLTTSGSPSFVGQPVTFTATVTSTHGAIPDGEPVTFYDSKTAIGTSTTASGVATFTTSSLKAEAHTINAAYAGDDTFEPSTGLVRQLVDKYTTTTALSSSPNPSNYKQAVTFTATVTSSGPTPTGKVEFKNGTKVMGSETMSGGVATLTTSKLAVGSYSITAVYEGDANSAKSTSSVLDQVVE
jgi:hypothetical protein